MIEINKKETFLLLGLLTYTEDLYASKDKSSVGKDLMVLEEKEDRKVPRNSPSKDEEKRLSDELLSKINNLSKKNLKSQESSKVSSIALSSYNNDRFFVNKEGEIVLLESN
jgi:hypothetical protein